MKMFFNSISKCHSSWYLSAAFLSNVGCFSARLPFLNITCTSLAVFVGFLNSLTAVIAALAARVIAYIMSCLTFISLLYFLILKLPSVCLSYFLNVSLPYMRLHSSYFLVCVV